MHVHAIHDFKAAVRQGPCVDGGYPLAYTVSDGGTLCHGCCVAEARNIMRAIRDGSRDGWRVVAADVYWEGPPLACDHCGRLVPSAYGDPDGGPCYVPRHRDGSICRVPWPEHVYRVDGLPPFRVTRSPGGPVVRWADYQTGIGLSEESKQLNNMIRRDRIPPMIAGRAVARSRRLRLARLTGGHVE